jgi:hypothetical protein
MAMSLNYILKVLYLHYWLFTEKNKQIKIFLQTRIIIIFNTVRNPNHAFIPSFFLNSINPLFHFHLYILVRGGQDLQCGAATDLRLDAADPQSEFSMKTPLLFLLIF